MCGIAGFTGPGDLGTLRAMTAALVHRGPDGEGLYLDPERPVFLGHRRLAVIDLECGAQPMWDAAGELGVVFNGEVYNHRELRAELQARGHRFHTDHSDTEVLLHGYREWGPDLPRRLNGMFAFCLYDRRAGRLFLARDRFGEKPLYYARRAGGFAFASELGALARHPAVSGAIDARSLQKFFGYGFIPAPLTIFEGCEKLPGGCSLTVEVASGRTQVGRYWRFGLQPEDAWRRRAEADLAEELRALLFEATRRRLEADVPLGFFLSGGLDSSAVLAAACRQLPPERLKAFTLGFSEPSFDESGPARAIAAALGVEHAVEVLDLVRARDAAPEVLARLDEPSADASALPTALLARFARRHVTVALTGDGADELFAGYDPFSALRPARLYRSVMPRPLHQILRGMAERLPVSDRNMSLDFKLRRTLAGLDGPPSLWNPLWLGPVDPKLAREALDAPLAPRDLYSEAVELWEGGAGQDDVDRTLEFFTALYLPDNILAKVDRAAMAASLETRAVFLDNDLVDFCRRLPNVWKMKGGRRKHLLKSALRGVLPPPVLSRRKKGFGVPTAKWLRTVPEHPPMQPAPGVRLDGVARLWADHRAGRADHRLALWGWLSLQTFQDGALARQGYPAPSPAGKASGPGQAHEPALQPVALP